MNHQTKEAEIAYIVKAIVKAKKAYYSLGKPIMSDYEYDKLESRLKVIDENHPILYAVGYDSTYDWWILHYKE